MCRAGAQPPMNSPMKTDSLTKFVLCVARILAVVLALPMASRAAPVSFTGSYTQDFQAMTTSTSTSSVTSGAMTEVSGLNGGTAITGWYIYGAGWTGAAAKWVATDTGSSSAGGFREMIDSASTVGRALGSVGSSSASGFFGVVLGGWILKLVLVIVLVATLKGATFIVGPILFVCVVTSVLGSLALDAVAVMRSRIPTVDTTKTAN